MSIYRWESRDEVYVERWVPIWDVLDEQGLVDELSGKWRKRTPRELAEAIIRATEGLNDPTVDAGEDHGSGRVAVYGTRGTTDKEKFEFDERAHHQWRMAREVYLNGRDKWETDK